MKRSGFTMIELIFVIVILGILAAVALPKFIGVSEQAQVGKLKAYVGSLNRTVAPSLWSQAISTGKGGKINFDATTAAAMELDLNASLPPLENIEDDGTAMPEVNLDACSASTTASATDANIIALGEVTTAVIGGTTYRVNCLDGNMSSAPHFYLEDGTTVLVK